MKELFQRVESHNNVLVMRSLDQEFEIFVFKLDSIVMLVGSYQEKQEDCYQETRSLYRGMLASGY